PEREGEEAVDLVTDGALGLEGRLGGVLGAARGNETDADDEREPDPAGLPHDAFSVRAFRPSSSWARVSGPVTRCTMRPLRSMNTLLGIPRRRQEPARVASGPAASGRDMWADCAQWMA